MRPFEPASPDSASSAGGLAARIARLRAVATAIVEARDERALAQRTAAFAFLVRVLSAAITLGSQILLARWLGRHDYGIFAFVWVMVILAGGLVPLGFPIASQRFLPQHAGEGDLDRVRGFLDGGRAFVFVASTLLALVGAAGLWLFEDTVSREYVLPLYLAIVCLPAYAMMDIQAGIARSYSWVGLALALPFVFRPVAILVVVGGVILVTGRADAVTASYALIASLWLSGLVQFVLLGRRLKRHVPRGPRAYSWRLWIATALPIFLVDGFYILLTSTDVLVLTLYRTPGEVGVYYAAIKTLALVSFVPFAVAAATAHKFAEFQATGRRDRIEELVRDTVTWTFWPAAGLTVLMVAAGRPLLGLFGEGFADAWPVMFILGGGLIVRAMVGPAERVLNMLGEQKTCAAVYAVVFALNLTLNLALIPPYGLAGAATATATALVAESILLYVAARARLGLHVFIVNRAR